MLIASDKAAEARVYWFNAQALHEGYRCGAACNARDRMRVLSSELFANPVLTNAAQRALVPRRYTETAQVIRLHSR